MKTPSSFPTALVLACALAAGTASAESAESADDTPAAVQAIPSPWWSALGDPALERLLGDGQLEPGAARDRQLELQAKASALYLKARIYSARLHVSALNREAAQRQWLLLEEEQRTDSDLGRGVAFALREATARERRFTELRAQSLEQLGALLATRWNAAELAALFAPALESAKLPLPLYEIPESLPGLVLRQRADVAAAETTLLRADEPASTRHLRLAEYLQALSASIEPGAARAADAGPPDRLGVVLQAARADVSARLSRLAAQGEEMQAQAVYVQRLAERYGQVLQGFDAGRVTELEALSGLQQMLAEQDRLAAAIGLTGLAWIALQQGIGGAGAAHTGDLLGAGSPSAD